MYNKNPRRRIRTVWPRPDRGRSIWVGKGTLPDPERGVERHVVTGGSFRPIRSPKKPHRYLSDERRQLIEERDERVELLYEELRGYHTSILRSIRNQAVVEKTDLTDLIRRHNQFSAGAQDLIWIEDRRIELEDLNQHLSALTRIMERRDKRHRRRMIRRTPEKLESFKHWSNIFQSEAWPDATETEAHFLALMGLLEDQIDASNFVFDDANKERFNAIGGYLVNLQDLAEFDDIAHD